MVVALRALVSRVSSEPPSVGGYAFKESLMAESVAYIDGWNFLLRSRQEPAGLEVGESASNAIQAIERLLT